MDDDGEERSSAPSKAKKSLFQKSAWAKPSEEAEAVDFFSRSKEIFSDIVAENKKKNQERLERKRSKESVERADTGKQPEKRRRLSTDTEDDGAQVSSDEERTSTLLPRGVEDSSATTPLSGRSVSSSAKTNRTTSVASPQKEIELSPSVTTRSRKKLADFQKPIITLSDSDDDGVRPSQGGSEDNADAFEKRKPIIEEQAQLSDEEEMFPELVAQARAKAEQRLLGRLNPNLSKSTPETSITPGLNSDGSNTPRAAPMREVDPVVQLLVTSEIEGTKPVIIRRKLSQRMKDVRLAWCDRQVMIDRPMSNDIKASIFLTWRKKRIFDVTSSKALGLKVDPSGRIYSQGGGVDNDGMIHLEAWTEETFAGYEKKKANQLQQQDQIEEEEKKEEPKPDTGPKFRIILNGKNLEPFKLVVKPSIYISAIIQVYKKQRHIPPDKEVSLYLDGDKLEPGSVAGDADLDEEDSTTIDVHVN